MTSEEFDGKGGTQAPTTLLSRTEKVTQIWQGGGGGRGGDEAGGGETEGGGGSGGEARGGEGGEGGGVVGEGDMLRHIVGLEV